MGADLSSDEHSPGHPQKLVALCRSHRSFFLLHPVRLNSRETVDSLTLSPATLRRYSRLSERVAAGRCWRSTYQEPPRAIVGLRGSARAPLRAQRSPFAHCLGVAFERRDAHTKGASDFDGGHGAFFGLDYLLAQVLRVGVHAPMVRQAQPYCKPL